MELCVLFMFYAVVMGAFCAYLANEKGKDGAGWFFLGMLFGIIALLVLVGLPSEKRTYSPPAYAPDAYRQPEILTAQRAAPARLCPYCISEIHPSATVCPHCQRDLPKTEYCALCRNAIKPTDQRVEDDRGNAYCCPNHRFRARFGA